MRASHLNKELNAHWIGKAYERSSKAGIGKVQKASNRSEYSCLEIGCKEKAIKSHSQQKKCQLGSIAEDGWVYSVEEGLYNLFPESQESYLLKKHN